MVKRKALAPVFSVLLCGGALLSDAAAAQTAYPLVCQPGGAMRIEAYHEGLVIVFRGAPKGSSERPPAAGECAWSDRGWRSGEPLMLTWFPESLSRLAVRFDGSNRITGWDVRGGAAGNMKYLLDSMLRKQKFFVHALRPNTTPPQLRISRIGP